MRRRTSALAASPLVTSVKVTVIAECAWKVGEGWDGRAAVASMGGKQVMGASRRRTLSLALALILPSTHLHVGHESDRVLRGVRGLPEGVVQVERLLLG